MIRLLKNINTQLNFEYNNEKKNILVYLPFKLNYGCGGILVLYYFSKVLDLQNENIRINTPFKEKNKIYNKIYNRNFNIDNTIVIYPEIINGNPRNAKYIIRWLLADINVKNKDIYKSWNKTDLVYFYNRDQFFIDFPEKVNSIYKQLTIIYLNPNIINYNNLTRNEYCYTFRKSYYHESISYIHPADSYELKKDVSQEKCIEIFNNYKYFICYDPLTFLPIIAILCGCISILYPLKNVDKLLWLKRSPFWDYLHQNNINNFPGLAYGLDDIEYAKNTINDGPEFIKNMINKTNELYINSFITDINNYENMLNTVQNIFYN